MSLKALAVRNFRNLEAVDIEPAAAINVISGANAAGKTSLLEAIHFLARVRSFRPTRIEQLVSREADKALVRGRVEVAGRDVTAAVERGQGQTRVRIDGADVRSLSALAQYFPLQVINSESQRLLLDGPKVRRSFLNWTMFHVEHDYYEIWRRYDRAVRQRNAALKLRDGRLAGAWEAELVEAGTRLDELRQQLVGWLGDALAPLLAQWLPEETITLAYRRGWPKDRSLAEAITEQRERELEAGFCLFGPHRSDLVVKASGVEAQHRLSRGQQKLTVIAILLAQAMLVGDRSDRLPMLLIDDLPAELDAGRLQGVMSQLQAMPVQSFITCVDPAVLPLQPAEAKWFHVEHGHYREMV